MHKISFLNRHNEFKRLCAIAKSAVSELVVIWGRRRVGKTRLLQRWIEFTGGVYWVSDESSAAIQRKYFSRALDAEFPGFSDVEYPDWQSLLSRLAKEAISKSWTGPLVIDEFPYLVATDKSLSSIIQHWLDNDAKKARLIVCLCGSSQRMMYDQFLDVSSPLYGRASEIMKLNPLEPGYMLDIDTKISVEKYFDLYCLLGGIPRYWELVRDWERPVDEIAQELVLSHNSILHEEVNRLLRAEQPSAMSLKPILDAIGLGVHKTSEIGSRLQQPASSMSRPLSELVSLGMVKREIPYGDSEKTSKRALYFLADPFLRFWFSVLAPNRSMLVTASENIQKKLFHRYWPDLKSKTWEQICQLAIPRLEENQYAWLPASRFWQNKGYEWDVVTMSFDKDILLLGECKCVANPVTEKQLEQIVYKLMQKGIPPLRCAIPSKVEYRVFINSLPHEIPELPENVRVYGLDSVFRALK